jgi:uroporphyrinogen-III synthase
VIPHRIFISRPIQEVGNTLQKFVSSGEELIAESLVSFESVSFEKNLACEVIFFSSIRAAEFYFNQEPTIPLALQYACAGQETAEKLKNQFQISCDFIAANAGNPNESAQIFKTWLGQRHVLFPKSEQSLNTYSSVLPIDQRTEIIVYRTSSISRVIAPCDLYIFSSPSNAKSFLENNQLPNEANCLAWGASTSAFLASRGIPVFHQLQTGTLKELDQFLTNFLELKSDSYEI